MTRQSGRPGAEPSDGHYPTGVTAASSNALGHWIWTSVQSKCSEFLLCAEHCR